MPTLAELIQEAKGDDSYETVARRGDLSSSQLHKYANGRNSLFPEPETISRLARGLRVSESQVLLAAAEGLGFQLDSGNTHPLLRLLPQGVAELPPWCIDAIVSLARQLVDNVEPEPVPDDAALEGFARAARSQVDARAAEDAKEEDRVKRTC